MLGVCCFEVADTIAEIVRVQLDAFSLAAHLDRFIRHGEKSSKGVSYKIAGVGVAVDKPLHDVDLAQ